jgi:rubrerythrin
MVRDRGGIVAYRDTDSSIIPASPDGGDMALPNGGVVHQLSWGEVDDVREAFNTLSHNPRSPLWTLKRGNRSSPLVALTYGPKRHAECIGEDLVDLTESGLGGTHVDPPTMPGRGGDGMRHWSRTAVRREWAYTYARSNDPRAVRPAAHWDSGQDLPFPALRRLMVKTPEMAKLLPSSLEARPGTRYIQASGAAWSGMSFGRTVVALDSGGDLSDWRDLVWFDLSTGERVDATTDPSGMAGIILETLDERATLWSRPPRSEPIDEVVIDPDLITYVGRVSGVIDADEDGQGDITRFRPVHQEARRLEAVQKEAVRMGYRAFARRTDLPEAVAKRAASRQPISLANVQKALNALGSIDPGRICALDGCAATVIQPNARFCSKSHKDKAYRRRKMAKLPSKDGACPSCNAVLMGTSAIGPCPVCGYNRKATG